MSSDSHSRKRGLAVRESSAALWALVGACACATYIAFARAIQSMVSQWSVEEFSHGYLVPFIALYLVWQRLPRLRQANLSGSWIGVIGVLMALALALLGRFATLVLVEQLALLLLLCALVLAAGGWQALRILRIPLAVLVFMVPMPMFLMNNLSSQLQLWSSTIGVWLMRLAGMAVFLEGNVIDLGNYRLEVAQACSGLRYLLPLMTLAFLVACMYRASLWKRLLIIVSSIPVTLIVNSLRIATIGVMVDRWGPGMAEGAVHAIQGWMMFMASTAVLMLEVMLLARIGSNPRPWRESFGTAAAPEAPVCHASAQAATAHAGLPRSAVVACAGVVVFAALAWLVPAPELQVPARASFESFPLNFGIWAGKRVGMEQIYLDALKLDDYILADYASNEHGPVNFYVAWYDHQSTGEATHSPRGCLPGGGWRIQDLRQVRLARVQVGGQALRVNRALIQYDTQRELVYYWFQQRGRVVTNEYLVKWYLLVDALRRHRTDGALVRVIVPMPPTMSEAEADRVLSGFVAEVGPRLDPYLPG